MSEQQGRPLWEVMDKAFLTCLGIDETGQCVDNDRDSLIITSLTQFLPFNA